VACLRNPAAASLVLAMAAAPAPSAGSFEIEMLDAHNLVRREVPVPPLVWSTKLAAVARERAGYLLSTGRFEHQKGPAYGENLFEARGAVASAARVVIAWASESANYDYRNNACRGTCGHYTQIVWRDTREVGCADGRLEGRQVVVCEYNPPGNRVGVKPW